MKISNNCPPPRENKEMFWAKGGGGQLLGQFGYVEEINTKMFYINLTLK